jgi:hypothetical protein
VTIDALNTALGHLVRSRLDAGEWQVVGIGSIKGLVHPEVQRGVCGAFGVDRDAVLVVIETQSAPQTAPLEKQR